MIIKHEKLFIETTKSSSTCQGIYEWNTSSFILNIGIFFSFWLCVTTIVTYYKQLFMHQNMLNIIYFKCVDISSLPCKLQNYTNLLLISISTYSQAIANIYC